MPSPGTGMNQKPLSGGVFVALGANLPHPSFGSPLATLQHAVRVLNQVSSTTVGRHSRWYRSRPVPASDQPWYVNGVAEIGTAWSPRDLLRILHEIEAEFGRQRTVANAARTLDLDLIDYDGLVQPVSSDPLSPILPHPRCHERAFVLLPLRELAPHWRHPVSGQAIDQLIASLGNFSDIEPMTGSQGPEVPG